MAIIAVARVSALTSGVGGVSLDLQIKDVSTGAPFTTTLLLNLTDLRNSPAIVKRTLEAQLRAYLITQSVSFNADDFVELIGF